MKAALARWFERRWYGGDAPGFVLRWAERLVTRAVRQRRAAFLDSAARMARPRVPVIVIGNLTVGGAGKTPLTIALVEGLRARGFRPGVVSRGYGRRDAGLRQVHPDDDAADVGDEPLLIARRTHAPVAVAPRRYDAARLLERSAGIDIVIADDGLQHYGLVRDIEVLVIDARRAWGNRRLLPAGPLREPVERAAACDFAVLNLGAAATSERAAADFGIANLHPMQLRTSDAIALIDDERVGLQRFAGRRVHAVAGIADPERFFETLRAHGIDPVPHPFPDHHAFTADDLAFDAALPVLMTEKDAVKCAPFLRAGMYSVPVDALLPDALLDAIAARARAVVIPEITE